MNSVGVALHDTRLTRLNEPSFNCLRSLGVEFKFTTTEAAAADRAHQPPAPSQLQLASQTLVTKKTLRVKPDPSGS
jgi:hypothetical protein